METFVGDTIKIILKTGIDLSGFSDLRIRYRKPDGTTGEWAAEVSLENSTYMEYTTSQSDLDQSGKWTFQAFARDEDTAVLLRGKWVNLEVLMPTVVSYSMPVSAQLADIQGSIS